MPLERAKYLFDVLDAIQRIEGYLEGCDLDSYLGSDLLRSATERQLTTIGEALNKLSRSDPALIQGASHVPRIIALRNILVHAYAEVDARIVWAIVKRNLPTLRSQVEAQLDLERLRTELEDLPAFEKKVRRSLVRHLQRASSAGEGWLWEHLAGEVLDLPADHELVVEVGDGVRRSVGRYRPELFVRIEQQEVFAARFLSILRRALDLVSGR